MFCQISFFEMRMFAKKRKKKICTIILTRRMRRDIIGHRCEPRAIAHQNRISRSAVPKIYRIRGKSGVNPAQLTLPCSMTCRTDIGCVPLCQSEYSPRVLYAACIFGPEKCSCRGRLFRARVFSAGVCLSSAAALFSQGEKSAFCFL